MPLITNKRGYVNRDIVYGYVGVAYVSGETYMLPETCNRLEIKNCSANILTLTLNGSQFVIQPFKGVVLTDSYTSFIIAASVDSSAFETVATVDKEDIDTEIDNIRAQLDDMANSPVDISNLATRNELNAVASGSPKGVYTTASALQTAFPTGNSNIYIVTADGKWYYWSGSAWTAGGVYQATAIGDGTVTAAKLTTDLVCMAKNMVTNGDFSNSTTGWTVLTGAGFAVNSGIAEFTATAQGGRLRAISGFTTTVGNKIYRAALVKTTSNQVGISSGSLPLANHTGSNTFELLSYISNAIATSEYVTVADNRTAGWDIIYVDNVIAIDLTATFGAGSEPSLSAMNAILSKFANSWFDGTVNILSGKDTINTTQEVLAARTSTTRNTTYASLDARLEAIEVIAKKSKYEGKVCVCFGDSITYNTGESTYRNYPKVAQTDTGMTIHNQGYLSANMTRNTQSPVRDAYSLCNLVDSIVTNTWTNQDIIYSTTGYETHASQITLLKSINFNTVDFVTIALGTNDWDYGTSITDNTGDPYDKTNIYGATRYVIKKFLENYPHLKFIIMTPIYRFEIAGDGVTILQDSDVMTNTLGYKIPDITAALKSVSAELKIPVLDMYSELGINKFNRVYYFTTDGSYDGIHPNDYSKQLMGHKLASTLLSLY